MRLMNGVRRSRSWDEAGEETSPPGNARSTAFPHRVSPAGILACRPHLNPPPFLPPFSVHVFFLCGLNESSPAAAFDTDLLVVGCGIAGAASALQAARLGMRVTMLSSAPNVDDCNSFWAQGGIIYKAEVSKCGDKSKFVP